MKTRLEGFVRMIAQIISDSVKPDRVPVVLVAADEMHPIFKEAFTAEGLLEPGIELSPAHLSPAEIREQVVRLIDRRGTEDLNIARARYQSAIERHRSSCELEEIVPAACEGRVDTLIAAYGERIWGLLNENQGQALVTTETSQSQTVDLVELAVRETLRHAGRVCVVPRAEIPDQVLAAAAFRWVSSAERDAELVAFREGR